MTPEELTEIERIKQLKARYFLLMDQKRWDEWADVFCEDVTIDTTEEGAPLIEADTEGLLQGGESAMVLLMGEAKLKFRVRNRSRRSKR